MARTSLQMQEGVPVSVHVHGDSSACSPGNEAIARGRLRGGGDGSPQHIRGRPAPRSWRTSAGLRGDPRRVGAQREGGRGGGAGGRLWPARAPWRP
ncbi:MAG: hypothetical protein M0C28_19340 [Candidatus Moduliflexus flocculans]|nr:hypothetical protein [Candidatus Moduliflexus flocculans]